MKTDKPIVCAYYFPNWHRNRQNDKWHGKGWTEWEVLKCARPRFPGHKQPKIPLWGYEDEAGPAVMGRKIKAASSHGIDGFIFDWYWYKDGPYRNRCLEEGFLKAPDLENFKFSIMWCNHEAKQVHPGSRMFPAPSLCSGEVSPDTFFKGTEHCIKHYFSHPNYMRLDGGLYFSIYHLIEMVNNLGGTESARKIFDDFRSRVKKAGLGELNLNAVGMEGRTDFPMKTSDNADGNSESNVDELVSVLGINSRSGHGWNKQKYASSFPFSDYYEFAFKNMGNYEHLSSDYTLPFNPAVCMGWDVSPRAVQSEVYENVGYPFMPILSDNSPDEFEKVLQHAKKFMLSEKSTGNMLLINSWNEWTEGTYIEPDTEYGYAYLEAVKHVFG
ncbi:MAG: hypothetical protein A2017_01010 [Lentisphaerae bacterium GWF2_44_16]|nr:MAG: hypothetical protein A2017_01010 [Lentisphaerae bacterium GWF2_44_16]